MKPFFRALWRLISAPFYGLRSVGCLFYKVIKRGFNRLHFFFNDTSQSTSHPLVEAIGAAVEQPAALLTHFTALRKHILRSASVVIILSFLAFYFIKPIMMFLSQPLPGGFESLTAIDITENIGAVMKIALLCGFTVSIPYIAFEVYLFVAPALNPNSRVLFLFSIPLALILFVGGMAFAYYIMLPVALPFLFNFMGLSTQPRPSSFFGFITAILFWIGLFFEFPLISSLLARLGVLRPGTLKSHWRIAVIVMALLAAIITPTVDPINMGLVMGPMIILYLISILFTGIAQKKRKQINS